MAPPEGRPEIGLEIRFFRYRISEVRAERLTYPLGVPYTVAMMANSDDMSVVKEIPVKSAAPPDLGRRPWRPTVQRHEKETQHV